MLLRAVVMPPLEAFRALATSFKGMCAWGLAPSDSFPKRVQFQVSTGHPQVMEAPEV